MNTTKNLFTWKKDKRHDNKITIILCPNFQKIISRGKMVYQHHKRIILLLNLK